MVACALDCVVDTRCLRMALSQMRKQRVDERATRLRAGLQLGQLRDGLPSDGKPSVSIEFRNQFRGRLPVSKRGRRGQFHRRSQGLDPAHEVLSIKAYGFLMHQQASCSSRSTSPHVGHPKPGKWPSIHAWASVSACASSSEEA